MDLIKSSINFFIASGILAWLIRSIVKLFLDKDIEKYKSGLAKQLTMHQSLITERMVVIKEVYKKIDTSFKAAEQLAELPRFFLENKANNLSKYDLQNELNILSSYYGENKIFFSGNHAASIDAYISDLRSIFEQWPKNDEMKNGIDISTLLTSSGKTWRQLQATTISLKEELESVFRSLIGVN